jgi:Transposase DDE domain/Transposase domain (DUF772)
MSFRDILSKYWNNIQCNLFPQIEGDLGELSSEHKTLVSVLELIRIEDFIPSTKFAIGRPTNERSAIARANIAKIVFKLPHTKQLVKLLNIDKQLRAICGFGIYKKVPSESTFSRAFKEFANSSLPEKVHQAVIKGVYKEQIIGHVVIDSTPLEVREKHVKKDTVKNRKKAKADKRKAQKAGEPNRRQNQLEEVDLDKTILNLPKLCDKGMKKSAQGYTKIWKGYKLHAAVDDHCIPLAIIVTSASLNDCEAAIPLITKTHQAAKNFYHLMDAAYDHPEIKKCSISLGCVPIIDQCPHSSEQKIEKEAEKERKKLLNFQTAEDKRYKERLPKERFNASYKDFNGGSNIFYRGHSKVVCHVMFGALAFTAKTIISLLQ